MERFSGKVDYTSRVARDPDFRTFQNRRPQLSAARILVTPQTMPAQSREEQRPTIAKRILEHVMAEPVVQVEVRAVRTLRNKLHRMVVTGGHAWQYEHMHLHEHLPLFLQHPLKSVRSLYIRVTEAAKQTSAAQQSAPFFEWLRRSHAQTLVVALMVFTTIAPVAQNVAAQHRYMLDAKSEAIVGNVNKNLQEKLTYDASKQLYQFNKSGFEKAQKAADPSNPVAKLMAMQAGGGGKDTKQLYSLDISENLQKGVTVYDNNLGLSFKMLPEFGSAPGRMENGRLVYPVDGGQVVYSLKGNGLKEDVLLAQAPKDGRFNMTYTLDLPQELSARLLPDGGIGIYSADPALYGNISFGDKSTEFSVMQSRKTSAKTNLVFALPAPVIKQSGGAHTQNGTASFQLHGDQLTLQANQLEGLSYPLSIDPTVVVTATSDFAAGNNEGNIDYPANQISRGALTGGSVGTWGSAGVNFPTARYRHVSVTYNGFLYVIGGDIGGGSQQDDIQYTTLSSTGTTGSWSAAATNVVALSSNSGFSAVAYNGYMYILGGFQYGTTYSGTVTYAPIAANGTIGTWTVTNSIFNARANFGATAYNGYMYVMAGNDDIGSYQDVLYAAINGDGSLSTWASTTGLGATTDHIRSVAYNGYMYMFGYGVTKYAPINLSGANIGKLGNWATTTAISTSRTDFAALIYNGYAYILGGAAADNGNNDIQYAPVNANGTLGTWVTSTTFSTARYGLSAVASNGYIVLTGGYNNTTLQADIQSVKIDPAGVTQAYASETVVGTARAWSSSVAYNGYLYVVGGCTPVSSDSCTTPVTTVSFAPIGATGTLGAWTNPSTTATGLLPAARGMGALTAYEGRLYYVAGRASSTTLIAAGTGNVISTPVTAGTGALGTWANMTTTATPGLTARYGHAALISNGYMYVIGGCTTANGACAAYQNDVEYAKLTIGSTTFATNPSCANSFCPLTTFTTARWGLQAVISGDKIYISGGTSGTVQSDVQYATISSTNTLSAWASAGTGFTTARYSHAFYVANGYLYVSSGKTAATTFVATVYYAKLTSTGTIATDAGCGAAWCATKSVTTALGGSGFATYLGRLYTVSGQSATGTVSTAVYSAPINNGGTGNTGTWSAGNTFTVARTGAATVAYNGYLYIIAGAQATSTSLCVSPANFTCNDVQYAPISNTGSIGAWHFTHNSTDDGTTFAGGLNGQARYNHAAIAYNGYMYVMGGYTDSTTQYAPINSDGTIGTWTNGTSLPLPVGSPGAAVYKGYLYLLGGIDNSATLHNNVLFAQISGTGAIGAWHYTANSTDLGTTNGSSLGMPTAREELGALAYNGYLYALGGTTDQTTGTNVVYYAPINSDGTIGTWGTLNSFTTVRYGLRATAENGFMYITGGLGSSYFNDTEVAVIKADGTLGPWVTTTTAFTTGRTQHGSVLYHGMLYVLGGSTASGVYTNTTQYASVSSTSRIGAYSKFIDLGSSAGISGITYTVSGVPDANLSYKAWASDGTTVASSGQMNSVTGGSGTCATPSVTARYVMLRVTIDDSMMGVFADSALTPSNVQDMTVTYTTGSSAHPPPNQRLRLGQKLQSGVLSALDTCGV